MIQIKRVYERAASNDGTRILVDRLWPRGISKEKAKIDYWAKDIAPSNELRKWYHHDPDKWEIFRQRYFTELDNHQPAVDDLLAHITDNTTFVFSSKETKLNNAYALKQYLVSYTQSSNCINQ